MKIKNGWILRQVADTWVVLAAGDAAVDFNGMLSLNSTGAFLWQRLEQGETDLAGALLEEYEVDGATARAHTAAFLEKLRGIGCLEE